MAVTKKTAGAKKATGAGPAAGTAKAAGPEQAAGPVKTIECPQCHLVHEVDVAKDGVQFTCDCGHVLDTDPLPQSAAGAKKTPGAAAWLAAWKARLVPLAKNWKVMTPAAAVVAALVLAAVFLHGPTFVLARGFTGHGLGPAAPARENPEPYLRQLEDNSRPPEHLKAAATLLTMHDSTIVPRLCELAARNGLVSRKLVLQLLGQLGDDRALAALEPLAVGPDADLSRLAVSSITQIGTPTAESVLSRLTTQPAQARDLLEAIAAVRNDAAGRAVGRCVARPELRSQATGVAGRFRLAKCTGALAAVARDRELPDYDRLQSLEVLGAINVPESRRVLRSLEEDSTVGWKAREILAKTDKDGGY